MRGRLLHEVRACTRLGAEEAIAVAAKRPHDAVVVDHRRDALPIGAGVVAPQVPHGHEQSRLTRVEPHHARVRLQQLTEPRRAAPRHPDDEHGPVGERLDLARGRRHRMSVDRAAEPAPASWVGGSRSGRAGRRRLLRPRPPRDATAAVPTGGTRPRDEPPRPRARWLRRTGRCRGTPPAPGPRLARRR